MARRFSILDVFTRSRLAGNQLAVVLDSQGLSGARMQAIAAEFNLSETVFVLPPDDPRHAAKIRIFTIAHELPFAGHPTIGAAVLLAMRDRPQDGPREGILVLEEPIGPVRVGVRLDGDVPFAEFDGPVLPEPAGPVPDADTAASAVGLLPAEIGFENHRPERWSAGVPFTFLPVRNLKALERCRPDLRVFSQAFGGSVYAYCRETISQQHHFHARMFAPGLGVSEDPATGAAAAAFAGQLMRFDEPPAGTHRYFIEQGHMIGRPSLIRLEIEVAAGLRGLRIGGSAVVTAEGALLE